MLKDMMGVVTYLSKTQNLSWIQDFIILERTSIHGLGFAKVKSTGAASKCLSLSTNKATQLLLLHTKMRSTVTETMSLLLVVCDRGLSCVSLCLLASLSLDFWLYRGSLPILQPSGGVSNFSSLWASLSGTLLDEVALSFH